MKLNVNAKEIIIPDTITTVELLLAHLGLSNKIVVVERNNFILEKEQHAGEGLSDGDKIEIVTFVGGG
ncbi:sulfur carrier protein ThiS [Ectobacillus sp. sgz5001026]|uniref:sulfur carrier protein ThiS n=1 Tax=Ectobacillus sp. sgz5001026 TaxID=3242473 RepID=UPI0036D3A636